MLDEIHKTKRRKLPHWTFVDSIYFVTWRLAKHQRNLIVEERDLIASALMHFDDNYYDMYCYVVMNDHVHVLFILRTNEALPKVIHSWKSYTANRLQRKFGRKGSVWQEEYFDRVIRTEKEFYRIARYILYNPYKRWKLTDYRWAWYRSDGGHGGPPSEINSGNS